MCFSPAGQTESIALVFCRQVFGKGYEKLDITAPHAREEDHVFSETDRLVVAFPTYAGRLPNRIMPYLKDHVRGKGTPAVGIVTFGGRSFDSSLAEMRDILVSNGFRVTGLGAFNAPHAMSLTLNSERPDEEDLSDIRRFSDAVLEKGFDTEGAEVSYDAEVRDYYTPLRADGGRAVFLKSKPEVDREKCTGCGKCIEACPMGSIDEDFVTRRICIKCHACIRCCTTGARFFDDADLMSHVKMLENSFSGKRKKNEWHV